MEDMFIGLGKNNIRIKDGVFTTNMKLGQLPSFFKILTEGTSQEMWLVDYFELQLIAERYIEDKNEL